MDNMEVFGLVYTIVGLLYIIGCCFEDETLVRRVRYINYSIRKKLCYKLWKYYMFPQSIRIKYIYRYPEDMIVL